MDKRESLTARYERVLGRPLNVSDTEGSHVESHETQPPPSSSRRREQVLQAQRTHRNRTQQYIRELEKEVFRLRDENDGLRQAMSQLQDQMRMAQITPLPSSTTFGVSQEESQQQQDVQPDKSQSNIAQTEDIVSVDLTGLADVVPLGSCGGHPVEISPLPYKPPSPMAGALSSNSSENHLTAQTGINFVLALETPCFPHVKYAYMGYSIGATPPEPEHNSGPGHLLNASARLAHQYHDHNLETSALELPSREVERLLDASTKLRLDGEVTPVQVWAMIREINLQGRVSVTQALVQQLVRELEQYVYCNSFGAVVEKVTVELVLTQVLGVS